MTQKVCCKETQVPCTCNMTDRDYLNDILASEKEVTKNTAIALTEASNMELFNEIDTMFNTVKDLQRTTYELAWNNGWYILEAITKTKQEQTLSTLEKRMQELE